METCLLKCDMILKRENTFFLYSIWLQDFFNNRTIKSRLTGCCIEKKKERKKPMRRCWLFQYKNFKGKSIGTSQHDTFSYTTESLVVFLQFRGYAQPWKFHIYNKLGYFLKVLCQNMELWGFKKNYCKVHTMVE